jgi:hypothetical protein
MNYFIDDVARILAGPTPRRTALKLIGGVLAGGLFGSVARGATICLVNSDCSSNQNCCGNACNASSDSCCPNGAGLYVGLPGSQGFCPPTQCCQGVCCCPPGTVFVASASDNCKAAANGYCTSGAPGSGNKCQTGG